MEFSRPSRPGYPTPRRVATAPIPLSAQFAASSPPSDGVVETLYNHPNAKIISFTASGRAFSRSLGRSSGLPIDEEPGTLSWSSQLERTIAVGPFRIYRAPGSVAFLNCGSALQPILPKSQCWCIDEVNSKFILQIRRPNYWRIELPVSDPEDQHRAQSLRVVFDQILQFEKTECPFKRSFTVILPERPKTPVKKRPWTPVHRSLPATPVADFASPVARSSPTASQGLPSTPQSEQSEANNVVESSNISTSSCRQEASSSAVQMTQADGTSSPTATTDKLPRASWTSPARSVSFSHDTVRRRASMVEQRLDASAASAALLGPKTTNTYPKPIRHPPDLVQRTGSTLVSDSLPITVEEEVSLERPGASDRSSEAPALNSQRTSDHVPPSGEDDVLIYELHEGTGNQGDRMKTRLRRRAKFGFTRSVTSPPYLSIDTEPPVQRDSEPAQPQRLSGPGLPAKPAEKPPAVELVGSLPDSANVIPDEADHANQHDEDEPQLMRRGSEDSFHSVQSWRSPVSPAPVSPLTSQPDSPTMFPYPHEGVVLPAHDIKSGCLPDETVISDTRTSWDAASNEGSEASDESVATAPDGTQGSATDSASNNASLDGEARKIASAANSQRPAPCHRPTTSSLSVRRRALSPLPSPANLFSPSTTMERRQPYRSKLETVKKIPLAIIAKTCEMIMGPPNHLINLMLKVAAKIAAGEWRGMVYGYSDSGEQIPVQWDYSEGEFSDWSDDEPYMASRNGHSSTGTQSRLTVDTGEASDDSRTWSVD